MAEIEQNKASKLSSDDAETLLNWRNWQLEALVYSLNMQQLLDLYHASSEYNFVDDWINEDSTAEKKFKKIKNKS